MTESGSTSPFARRSRVPQIVATLLSAAVMQSVAYADEAKGRQLYDEGQRAYNVGQFARAATLFTQAYEEWPRTALLFNIAQSYREAGDCKQAHFLYRRYLHVREEEQPPLEPERRKDIEARIADLDECIRRDVASAPPGTLENANPPSTPTATTPTTVAATNVQPSATEQPRLTAPVAEPPPPKPVVEPKKPDAEPAETAEAEDAVPAPPFWNNRRMLAAGLGGGGVVALAVGTVLGLSAKSSRDDARAAGCNSDLSMCPAGVLDTARSAYNQGRVATVMFIGAGLLVGAGATLWLMSSVETPRTSTAWRITPTVDTHMAQLGLERSF